jgi:hypothetical protein
MNTQLSFSPIRVKTSPAQHWLANQTNVHRTAAETGKNMGHFNLAESWIGRS